MFGNDRKCTVFIRQPSNIAVKAETVEALMETPINEGQEGIKGYFSMYEKHLNTDSFCFSRNSVYCAELRLHRHVIKLLGSALTCLHQVLDTDFINWEEGSGCSILWTHVGNGGSVSNG